MQIIVANRQSDQTSATPLLVSYYDPSNAIGIFVLMAALIVIMGIPYGIKYLLYPRPDDRADSESKE